MKGKILGVGWAKTGTTTLGEGLQQLGFRHQSRNFDLVDEDFLTPDKSKIRAFASSRDSFEDWPWLLLFREFDSWFPGTRFILTIRDSGKWIRSYRAQLARVPESDVWNRRRTILYGLPFPNVSDDQLIARYERHNAEVLDYFRDRPGDLLVVDWSRNQGWAEVCSFLRTPIPSAPFPHANRAPKRSLGRRLRGLLRRNRSRTGPA